LLLLSSTDCCLLLLALVLPAAVALVASQGVGTAEDIDKGLRLGTNQPMGPLRLADFIGEPCLLSFG
jgi:3-hydroxybutyryl-CoA dehydrogenase